MGQGAMTTVLVRRWTRREYERMVDAGVFPQARYGWSYRDERHVAPGDHISPLAAPQARVAVADLLP